MPGLQAVHAADNPAPLYPPYLPRPQAVHTTGCMEPATSLNWPAGQAVQTTVPVVSALYAPAEQIVQAGDVAVSTEEYDPAVHAVQADAPTSVL